MFNFVAIDFETADSFHPCSLGIAIVVNSKIIDVKHWLIKPACYPYFHYYAQKIHGIKKKDVENQPEFDKLWENIKPFIENKILVAHNASFDINVLRKTLTHYKIPVPKFNYFCSYSTARLTWRDNKKASLDFLCEQEGIELNHHNADSDASACALLFLKELELLGIKDLKDLKTLTIKEIKKAKIAKQEREISQRLFSPTRSHQ